MARNAQNLQRRGGVIGAALAVGVGLALLFFKFGLGLAHLSYDLPFAARPVIQPGEVVLVYMDDDSHRELGQPYDGPWNRELHARLVERLAADGAKAVIFDILFTGPNRNFPEGDEHFARAIKANGKVVLGAEYTVTAEGAPTLIRAIDAFCDAAAVSQGFVQLSPDQDFTIRQHLHAPPEKDADSYSSMTWEAARWLGAPAAQNPAGRFTPRWLNYYGPPGTIPHISFHRAMETNDFCPAGAFSNKVVFVGSALKTVFSGQHKDEYRTPYTRGLELCPAMDMQATQFLNLLRGDWLTALPRPVAASLIVLAGIVFGYGLIFFRPLPATGIALAGAAACALVAGLAFVFLHVWSPWMIIVAAQIPIALLWSIIFNSIQLYVQNKLFEQSLALYLSPKLVKKFSTNRDLLQPGAKKETLTILFSDIAGFTTISEGMDSDDLAKHMNAYFQSAVADCIHHTDGTIVKYIGDAIFAFWNAPDPQPDHARRACEAALRFRDQPPQFMNGQQLITRIGLHTGVANVGNFGSTTRVDYTALGENINLASRMEGLNKHLGTEVLLTGETRAEIGDQFLTRELGLFRLKGFEKSVAVFELCGRPDESEKFRPLHTAFAAALALFREKKFTEAEAAFNRVLELRLQDGSTKFYLKHLAELRDHPLPADWSGEVELKEK